MLLLFMIVTHRVPSRGAVRCTRVSVVPVRMYVSVTRYGTPSPGFPMYWAWYPERQVCAGDTSPFGS